jgi:hypothetical protein
MAKNKVGLMVRLIGGVLFLFLLIWAVAWLRIPKMPAYASLSATRFDGLPLGREQLIALPVSVRGILQRPNLVETPVSDLAQAARYAEFEPRLPRYNGQGQALPAAKLSVVAPSRSRATIRAGELQAAVARTHDTDLVIPLAWDSIRLEVNTSAGIIADYEGFRLSQRLPLEFRAPDSFPLEPLLEVLFRIGGMNGADAAALAKRSRGRPTEFLELDPRFRITARTVRFASGTGMLLTYTSDDGVERLTLAWSEPDRAYFLSAHLTEIEAISIANSIQ